MKPERMRIVLAEWDGWRIEICGAAWILRRPDNTVASSGHRADHDIRSLEDYQATWKSEMLWPDYPNSLDAVHELEAKLPSEERTNYQFYLDKICSTAKDSHCSCWDFIHATAAQRCEALLKTLNLWEEE